MTTRVLVNAVGVQSGGGATQLGHFARLADIDREIEYVMAVSDAGLIPPTSNTEVILPALRGPRNLASVLWHQLGVNRWARDFDVVLSIANQGPISCRRPHVLFARNVKHIEPRRAGFVSWARDNLARAATRRADIVLTPSSHMADLVASIRPRGQVVEAPHGFTVAAADPAVLATAHTLGWAKAERRFLYVGSGAAHKNLALISDNLDLVTGEGSAILFTLGTETLRAAGITGPGVHPIGSVGAASLAALYRHATCVVVPSLQESFSLPVLEALGHGTPVAASDIPVHRELGSTCVDYFGTSDRESLEKALHHAHERCSSAWEIQARDHAACYTWERQYEVVREAVLRLAGSA